jgi:hypothetical protein
MAWANFSVFAVGSLLMGIPLLLHLLMKKRPKRYRAKCRAAFQGLAAADCHPDSPALEKRNNGFF